MSSFNAIAPCELFDTSPPSQNGRHFADDIFKCIFMNEKFRVLIQISLKFIPRGLIENKAALVQVMACRRTGDKPLSEPMMARIPTHICITQPQWFNTKMGHHWFRYWTGTKQAKSHDLDQCRQLTYCPLRPEDHIWTKPKSKLQSFHSRKCIEKCSLQNCGYFVHTSMC